MSLTGSNIRCIGAAAVSSVEDPEKMLEQTVNEMQSDLIKMRQASAQVWSCYRWVLESAVAMFTCRNVRVTYC